MSEGNNVNDFVESWSDESAQRSGQNIVFTGPISKHGSFESLTEIGACEPPRRKPGNIWL